LRNAVAEKGAWWVAGWYERLASKASSTPPRIKEVDSQFKIATKKRQNRGLYLKMRPHFRIYLIMGQTLKSGASVNHALDYSAIYNKNISLNQSKEINKNTYYTQFKPSQ